ncbi:MAG: sulfite exporter TauE/SafE family protein [Clostridiales bacterium]|nr:sulfite exporter TauE/SafE family protein [Clostridiales bacterium]
MIDTWLNQIAEIIGSNLWLAPLLALIAGVLTSVTPCALSSIPLIIGYVGGVGEKNTKKAFAYSAVFSVGTAVTFVALGIIATSAGKLMGTSSPVWYMVLGVLMVLMALQTWEIFNFIPSVNLISKSKKKGFAGAFLAGILGGVFSSPCSTPVLIALLAIVAGEGNLLWGILLMLLYSIGHSALVMVAGTSVGFVQKINSSEKYKTAATVLKMVMGAAILLIGLYMFWLAF